MVRGGVLPNYRGRSQLAVARGARRPAALLLLLAAVACAVAAPLLWWPLALLAPLLLVAAWAAARGVPPGRLAGLLAQDDPGAGPAGWH